MSLNADIMLLFENETGLKSIYNSDGKTYHTLKYVDWLEGRLQKHWVANDSASDNKLSSQLPELEKLIAQLESQHSSQYVGSVEQIVTEVYGIIVRQQNT